jgi:hypothetical protein
LHLPLPANVPPALIEDEVQLLQDTRRLQNWIRDAPNEAARRRWVEAAATVRTELNALWDTLIRDYGASDYVALRRNEKLRWEDVQHWLGAQGRRVALLEFFTLTDGLIAFIVREGESEPRVVPLDISIRQMFDFTLRFHFEVRYRFNSRDPLDETWRGLGPLLLPKLMPHLKDAELLCVIPHVFLHELPLHALEYEGKPLIEHFPIAYAPSVAAAMRVAQPASAPISSDLGGGDGGGPILVVGNPRNDLPFAEEEAQKVAARFGVQPLLRDQVTKNRVLTELEGVSEAHFVAHGFYRSDDPLESGIRLADGTLTARDVLTLSLNIRLLALWVCESAAQDIRPGDEREGFASAFLYAGVSSLVLSLWEAEGAATMMLMEHFRDHLYDSSGAQKNSTADALRAAMLETREEWPHTYFWAPFVLYGNWR